jgi:hypothetical protein
MPRWIRRRLTYANVIATLALFLALNVGAYAAIKIPPNSIGPAQLKNKAVTPKKVSPAAIKLFRGTKGQKGPQGAKGLPGPAGAQGPGGTAVAFAAVNGGPGTTVASQTKNVVDANITHPASGVYCFALPFTPKSAMVNGSNLMMANDTLATVYVRRAGDGPPADCSGNDNVRVRTLDLDGNPNTVSAMYSPALRDHDFFIWFE